MAVLSVLAVATGCQEEKMPQLAELQVSSSIIAFPKEGTADNPVKFTVTSNQEWKFAEELPAWVKVVKSTPEPVEGVYPAGVTEIMFSAEPVASDNVNYEDNVKILVGDKVQHLIFKQGVQSKVPVPLKEIVENGVVGTVYYVDAIVMKIENTKYGNYNIKDNLEGQDGIIAVYGTLNGNGETGKFNELGLAEGDRILAHGEYSPYNDKPQLKNITIDKIYKSLVQLDEDMDLFKLEKEEQTIEIKLKKVGGSLEVEPKVDWLTLLGVNIADGAGSVKLKVDENKDVTPRETVLEIKSSLKGETSIANVTINQKGQAEPIFEESFMDGFGQFTIENVIIPEGEEKVWSSGQYNNVGYVKASGHYGGKDGHDKVTEAYLISPVVAIEKEGLNLVFEHCGNYFKGSDNSADAATILANFKSDVSLVVREEGAKDWTKLEIPSWGKGSDYTYVSSGDISLSSYAGKKIQFAFKYTSSEKRAGTWQIRNTVIK